MYMYMYVYVRVYMYIIIDSFFSSFFITDFLASMQNPCTCIGM